MGGTVLAASALRDGVFESEPEAKRNVARAIETVAKRLGNTPAICRKCYVHPAVVEAYVDRTLPQARGAGAATSAPGPTRPPSSRSFEPAGPRGSRGHRVPARSEAN